MTGSELDRPEHREKRDRLTGDGNTRPSALLSGREKKKNETWLGALLTRPLGELMTQPLCGYQQATEWKMEISCRGETLAQVPE
jgi:hypothetical protein